MRPPDKYLAAFLMNNIWVSDGENQIVNFCKIFSLMVMQDFKYILLHILFT